MNLNPRKNFNESPHRAALHEAVATSWFQAAALAALAEMQYKLTSPNDMTTAASWQWKMEGAKQVLGILMDLTETAQPEVKRTNDNLTHKT